jgi:hypothetical protein
MATHTPLRPLDRLHWLLMRRRLGDKPPVAASPESHNDLSKLPAATLLQVARVTAYLSRMVARARCGGVAGLVHRGDGALPAQGDGAAVPAAGRRDLRAGAGGR